MNRLERNMLAFAFGLALACAVFMPAAHAIGVYQTDNYISALTDYHHVNEFPQCNGFGQSAVAGIGSCICYNRTGNNAHTNVASKTISLNTSFTGTAQTWQIFQRTCNADSSTFYLVVGTNGCNTATVDQVGINSPVDLMCKTDAALFADIITAYDLSTAGEIDMTEMIDAMNLNAEQVATLILYCCVAVAFILGVKTGLMR